jgi:hypothetical protein
LPARIFLRARAIGLLVALTAVSVTLMPVRAEASPHRETFITLVGEPGDFITQGTTRSIHTGTTLIGIGGSPHVIDVETGEGPDGEAYSLWFEAPLGERLQVGHHYVGATESADLGVPAIRISGGSRGCNSTRGRFLVKDLFFAQNEVARFWVVFEQRCGGGLPMVGEVRYRMPGDGGGLMVAPRSIWWPIQPIGGTPAPVAVRAVNTTASPLIVSSVAIEGSPEVGIRYDDCSGRSLASNESCAVWVRFAPASAGLHEAQLRIVEPSGATHVTGFRADVVPETAPFTPHPGEPGAAVGGGPTEFSFESDAGDYIGQGETRSYTPANAIFSIALAGHHVIRVDVFGNDGEHWSMAVGRPRGDLLMPGFHYDRDGPGEAGMDVSGASRACNDVTGSFEVHALRIDDLNEPVSLRVTFEQVCGPGPGPGLRGTFSWQHPGPLPTLAPFPTPPPDPGLARLVTITIRDRRVQGVVRAEEGTACIVAVPVRLQRKIDGRFRTVATLTADGSGGYVRWIGKRYGVYRAVAPRVEQPNGTICLRDVSPNWRY